MDFSRWTEEVGIILGGRRVWLRGLSVVMVNRGLRMFNRAVGLFGGFLELAEASLLVHHALGFLESEAVVD